MQIWGHRQEPCSLFGKQVFFQLCFCKEMFSSREFRLLIKKRDVTPGNGLCFRLCVRAKIPVHACRAVKVTEIERKHETGKLGKIFLFVLAAVVSESRESIRKEKEREKS